MNKILFKIFGVMSKERLREISKYFSINPLEEVISARRDKFLKRYCTLDNLCQYMLNIRSTLCASVALFLILFVHFSIIFKCFLATICMTK